MLGTVDKQVPSEHPPAPLHDKSTHFAALVDSIRLLAYAQNAEDIVLIRAFSPQTDGFYVDVGAGLPDTGSLTKNLYDLLGWHGINLEPHPDIHPKLAEARDRDITLPIAAGSSRGRAKMALLPDNWGMSTLDWQVAERHRQTGWEIKSVEVDVLPLDEILDEHHVPPGFDLLKIDVEGHEADVLASIDLVRWHPRVIVVEATEPASVRPTHEAWEPQLLDQGYCLALFDGLNRFYCALDEPELFERLTLPANVFDRYIHYKWWALLSNEARQQIDRRDNLMS